MLANSAGSALYQYSVGGGGAAGLAAGGRLPFAAAAAALCGASALLRWLPGGAGAGADYGGRRGSPAESPSAAECAGMTMEQKTLLSAGDGKGSSA